MSCQAFQLTSAMAGGSGSAATSAASSAAMPLSYTFRDRYNNASALRLSSAAPPVALRSPALRFLVAVPAESHGAAVDCPPGV